MTPYELFLTLPSDLHIVEVAKRCGVSRQTIYRWQHGPPKTRKGRWNPIDFVPIDKMIRENTTTIPKIAEQFGLCVSTIVRRKRFLITKKPRNVIHNEKDFQEKMIPPAERFEVACKRKAHILGMTVNQFKENWLRGPEGPRWAAQIMGGAA